MDPLHRRRRAAHLLDVIARCGWPGLSTNLVHMILHSSLAAATADTHRRDLIVAAERYHTAAVIRRARRALRSAVRWPDPPREIPRQDENTTANRRYAVSR